MSRFHSIMGRRDFMKALGLGTVGLGAAAVSTPVFHDLDELISSPSATLKQPWYVKNREYGDIGIELDWDLLKPRLGALVPGFSPTWNNAAKEAAIPSFNAAAFDKAVDAKTKELWPDYRPSTRDYAFANACSSAGIGSPFTDAALEGNLFNGSALKRIVKAPTPEELGVPRWEGTPEENQRMVRAALTFIGMGPAVGCAELNTKTKNFFYQNHYPEYVWDDNITETYYSETEKIQYLPSSHRYVVVTNNMGTTELGRRSPSVLTGSRLVNVGAHVETISYSRTQMAKVFFEQFIRGIGYHCFYSHTLQPAAAWAQLSGVGEHARMGSMFVSPIYGCNLRTHMIVYTDLPQAYTPPTDGGVTKFCETCGICSENCPVGAIPPRDIQRNWDNASGQNWGDDIQEGGSQVMWNIPGYKGWRLDMRKCQGCCSCKFSCPFNTLPDSSFLHSVVKATSSTTPIFNSFFREMEGLLHYGKQDKDPESWWNDPNSWFVYGANSKLML
ncbi:reductive dehalogenase [Dehalococcoides sp. THU3]|nr:MULTISPECIES: reductive dehalogenase [Dehalococcoides]AOV98761.1 reductive dehalogenase [Dehalococcoides mccartyi]QYY58582.1 reductive dehalogenase [Dehalococcoides mccartyi]BAQ34034.1 putative reductive dehalogenase [Dehalococcoides sp. UCH007]BEL00369.1 hypothetical protein DMOBY_02220 [Dehalococcoides mccartyi]